MKTLHLTLKKKWFDMIASGEKKEEYREMKLYWINRLVEYEWYYEGTQFYDFDIIVFKNGYDTNAPKIVVECLGNPEWGAPKENVFIIKLGKILSND